MVSEMDYNHAFELVKNLEFDTNKQIIKTDREELYIFRPSKISKRFKNYDINKNFQIWLKEEGKEPFRPNHLRVMLDLNLRARSRPDLKREMLLVFDKIFYHNYPESEIKKLSKEHFEHSLNPLEIIANLSQLFIIEQEYCYYKESNYIPPTLFYQGWVRAFIDGYKEVDIMSLSLGNRQPPPKDYTNKENKKGKDFEENLEPLWYLH